MMTMQSRNQYLDSLIRKYGGYHLKSKKEKTKLLDEYCDTTGQNRKYMIRKIRNAGHVYQQRRKNQGKQRKRTCFYDQQVVVPLIRCWQIFDYPCGQRLVSSLETEVDRLRKFGELICSDSIAQKLKKISPRTIDTKLKPHKEKEFLKRKYSPKSNPLLYQKIPIKLSNEWDRGQTGNTQIDLVEHCGQSTQGEYAYTLSTIDIATGWWEGNAQLGRGQKATVENIQRARGRCPFDWRAIHSDNDSAFINAHLYNYTETEDLDFSRSRPYKKNDNCFVEQKNSTHVRRCVGYYRYDTKKELDLLNGLYANEIRLYKNFFQPIIMLEQKERIGGHIKRRYRKAKTPYQYVMESPEVSEGAKRELQEIYQSLNPAQLKREMEIKFKELYALYLAKGHSLKAGSHKKLTPRSVTFLNCTTSAVSVT